MFICLLLAYTKKYLLGEDSKDSHVNLAYIAPSWKIDVMLQKELC